MANSTRRDDDAQTQTETEVVETGNYVYCKAVESFDSFDDDLLHKLYETGKGCKVRFTYRTAHSGYSSTKTVEGRIVDFTTAFMGGEMTVATRDGLRELGIHHEDDSFCVKAVNKHGNTRVIGDITYSYDDTGIDLLRPGLEQQPVEDEQDDNEDDDEDQQGEATDDTRGADTTPVSDVREMLDAEDNDLRVTDKLRTDNTRYFRVQGDAAPVTELLSLVDGTPYGIVDIRRASPGRFRMELERTQSTSSDEDDDERIETDGGRDVDAEAFTPLTDGTPFSIVWQVRFRNHRHAAYPVAFDVFLHHDDESEDRDSIPPADRSWRMYVTDDWLTAHPNETHSGAETAGYARSAVDGEPVDPANMTEHPCIDSVHRLGESGLSGTDSHRGRGIETDGGQDVDPMEMPAEGDHVVVCYESQRSSTPQTFSGDVGLTATLTDGWRVVIEPDDDDRREMYLTYRDDDPGIEVESAVPMEMSHNQRQRIGRTTPEDIDVFPADDAVRVTNWRDLLDLMERGMLDGLREEGAAVTIDYTSTQRRAHCQLHGRISSTSVGLGRAIQIDDRESNEHRLLSGFTLYTRAFDNREMGRVDAITFRGMGR